jgi:hypothetical protein
MKILLFVFYLSLHHLAFGQFNLVQNPSFEICTICPINIFGQIDYSVSPVNVILPGWNNPNLASPDYFNPGLQAMDGNSYAGLWIFLFNTPEGNVREYLQCEFNDTLIIKEKYLIEFFVRIDSDNCNFMSNNLSLLLTDSIIEYNNDNLFLANAQLKYFNNEIIVDSSFNWHKFSGVFESQGGERFMTVGNFNLNSQTEFICTSPFWPASGGTYIHIDKFSVTPLDSIPGGLQVNAGLDHDMCIGDTVFIGEKISNLPANWYLLDGTVVDTNTAGVYVHPSVTTTYVVTMTINNVSSSDTVTVNVGCLGIDEPEKQKFTIYPVPNDGDFTLTGQITKVQTISIKTMNGKVVYSMRVEENTELQTIHTSLESGVYFVLIEDESNHLLSRNKFVVTK